MFFFVEVDDILTSTADSSFVLDEWFVVDTFLLTLIDSVPSDSFLIIGSLVNGRFVFGSVGSSSIHPYFLTHTP